MKNNFYSLENILKCGSTYNIIGLNGFGKSMAVFRYALEEHIDSGYVNQLAIIRRRKQDFNCSKAKYLFDSLVALGLIAELTEGKYNSVYYSSQKWYLCLYENGKMVAKEETPFAVGVYLRQNSGQYPEAHIVLFDDFISECYIPNELRISVERVE